MAGNNLSGLRNPPGEALIDSMNQGRVRLAHHESTAYNFFSVRKAHPADMAIPECHDSSNQPALP